MDSDMDPRPPVPLPLVEQGPIPPLGFADFFSSSYRHVLRAVMAVGATVDEAEEATAAAMTEVLVRWKSINHPAAWARRAAISNFIKAKTRNLDRVRRRLVEYAAATGEAMEDPNLTVWENRQWVDQVLATLPPAQRESMSLILDGYTPAEVAVLLGRSPEAIRQRLTAARRQLRQVLEHQRNQRPRELQTRPRRRSSP